MNLTEKVRNAMVDNLKLLVKKECTCGEEPSYALATTRFRALPVEVHIVACHKCNVYKCNFLDLEDIAVSESILSRRKANRGD